VRAVIVLLLMSWLGGVAWAAGADDPRAQLRLVKENLDLIDQAQMSYGGRYPPQLVTDISRYVALPAQLEEWRGAMRAAEARLDAGSTLALQVERDDRLALMRETACPPAPADLQPGRAGRPQLDASRSEPTEKYFPLRARREDRVGRVGVEADVGADGCATRAVVLVSSGEPDFDRAALNWALQGAAYRPAQGADGLAAGRTRFWVKFELLNP